MRPLSADDLDSDAAWLREVELRPDRWRDDDTRAVGLEQQGALVAAGMLWTSRAHADRYWAEIVVHPQSRRQGLGRSVFAHLGALRRRDLPFMTRGYVDEERLAFAFALGARTIQVVPPASVSTARRSVLRQHPSVVPASRVAFPRVMAAHAAMYEWIHRSWSPVADRFAEVVNAGLDEDLDLEASALALDADGGVRALAAVYRDVDPPVVCAETTRPDDADGERLVEGCLRYALDVLSARGVVDVEFDGHVTDPHFLPNWAKLAPGGRWFLLVEVPPHE